MNRVDISSPFYLNTLWEFTKKITTITVFTNLRIGFLLYPDDSFSLTSQVHMDGVIILTVREQSLSHPLFFHGVLIAKLLCVGMKGF